MHRSLPRKIDVRAVDGQRVGHLTYGGSVRKRRPDQGDLLDRYSDYLRLLARLQIGPLLRGKLDPADVAQETLMLAYQKLGQYRGQPEGPRRRGYLSKLDR